MVRTDSIQFDSEVAQKRADARGWDVDEWARQADVSNVTIRKWLAGDTSIKFRTVEDIVRPLGLTAADVIRKNGKKKLA